MAISIQIGGRDCVESGTVVVRPGNEVFFRLENLAFRLVFRATEDKKLNVAGELSNANELNLSLENFESPLGISYWAEIGTLRNRKLFLDLVVHSLGDGADKITRSVSYTFSLGEAANG
jgi:hypothetical protein